MGKGSVWLSHFKKEGRESSLSQVPLLPPTSSSLTLRVVGEGSSMMGFSVKKTHSAPVLTEGRMYWKKQARRSMDSYGNIVTLA